MHLKRIQLAGYRSFSPDAPFELRDLGKMNVLLGPNGVGKSNLGRFASWLRQMLEEMNGAGGQPLYTKPSLAHPRAPLIVVNTAFSAQARLFTMLHELGHLVRGTDSVCSTDAVIGAAADPEERWCEVTAAATLIPWPECAAFMTAKLGWQGAKVTELAQAKRIATHFRVSLRAAVLRLIEHGAASWPLFRAIPPAADSKSGGGGGEGRTRLQARRDELGERTLDLVARGLRRDLLGRGDVVAYLRVPPLALEQEAAGAS